MTGQQKMLTPLWHLVLPLIFSSPCFSAPFLYFSFGPLILNTVRYQHMSSICTLKSWVWLFEAWNYYLVKTNFKKICCIIWMLSFFIELLTRSISSKYGHLYPTLLRQISKYDEQIFYNGLKEVNNIYSLWTQWCVGGNLIYKLFIVLAKERERHYNLIKTMTRLHACMT